MKFFALVKDSLRETMDKKSFWVLGILSLVFVLFCWSLSFKAVPPEEALQDAVSLFNVITSAKRGKVNNHRVFADLEFKVTDIKEMTSGPGRFDGGWSFTVTALPADTFYEAVAVDDALHTGKIKSLDDTAPGKNPETGKYPEPPAAQQTVFLTRRYSQEGFDTAIEAKGGGVFSVRAKTFDEKLVRGAHKMGFLFGLKYIPLSVVNQKEVIILIEAIFAEFVAGLIGVILALIFTAFFIPGMLEKGNIELLLARPMPRGLLLVYKFLGGLLYVFLLAVVLFGGSWLALSVRSGYWNPTYLWSIGVLTFYFAILYSVSVLFGVLWRSWIGSVLMTALAWMIFTAVNWMYEKVHDPLTEATLSQGWVTTADVTYYALPKTRHLSLLNQLTLAKSTFEKTVNEDESREAMGLPAKVTWNLVLLSSSAFIVAMLGLACWRFSRKDY